LLTITSKDRANVSKQRANAKAEAAKRMKMKADAMSKIVYQDETPRWKPLANFQAANIAYQEIAQEWLSMKRDDPSIASDTHALLEEMTESVSHCAYYERRFADSSELHSEFFFNFRGSSTHFRFTYRNRQCPMVGRGGGSMLQGTVELLYSSKHTGEQLVPLVMLDTHGRGYMGGPIPDLGCLPPFASMHCASATAWEARGLPVTREELALKHSMGLSVPYRVLDQPDLPMSELWLLVCIAAAPGSYHEQLQGMITELYGEHLKAWDDF